MIEFKGFDLSQRLGRHEPWNIRQCGMASRSDDDAGASNYSRPSSAVAARPMAAALACSAGSPSARSPELHRFRRLAGSYERHDRVHHAFLTLGCALICWNHLKSTGRVF